MAKITDWEKRQKLANLASKIDPQLIKDITKFPKIEPPIFEEDCKFVDCCQYTTKACYAGANLFIHERCSKERINQMLDEKDSASQSINVEGSNIQINQQGNHSISTQKQEISIQEIPQDLLDEFKLLIKEPVDSNRGKWTFFLEKFNLAGGTINLLMELIKLFSL